MRQAFSAGDRRRKLEKTSMGPACVPKAVDWVLVDGAELVEGEKVAALAYMAKAEAGVAVAAEYEQRLLALVRRLGEPIHSNFIQQTYRADGSPCYRPADPPAPAAPASAGPASTPPGA